MAFPNSILTEIDTFAAEEVLAHLSDAPCSLAVQAWCDDLRIDVCRALAQSAATLFPGGVEG